MLGKQVRDRKEGKKMMKKRFKKREIEEKPIIDKETKEITNKIIMFFGFMTLLVMFINASPSYSPICESFGYDHLDYSIHEKTILERDGRCYFTCEMEVGDEFIIGEDRIVRNETRRETKVFWVEKGNYSRC